MNRPFSLLVKPASGDCNLRCEYCFYWQQHLEFYPDDKLHRMSDEVLDHLIKSFMATSQSSYQIGWQGGEPTMMGVDFFEKVINLQKRYGRPGATVGNGLQTNGVLLDERWAKMLAKNNFLAGISLDGPKAMHDKYRLNMAGQGTYDQVMKGINNMRHNSAEFNILTLVNNVNVKQPAAVYKHLCDNNFKFHQYIACVEPDGKGGVLPFSISGKEWGEFLCTIFDIWYKRDTRQISVRFFDSILGLLVDGSRNQCTLGNDCRQYLVVEYNGDIYPCDFFVEHKYKLGNIMEDSWESLLNSSKYEKFGCQKSAWNSKCDSCDYKVICLGDCLKHRLCANGGDSHTLSHLCDGWKMFYDHTMERFEILAEQIVQERSGYIPPVQSQFAGKIGRNELCPCGSGKKYKKCCGS